MDYLQIRNKLINNDYFKGWHSKIYRIEKNLSKYTPENITAISNWIDESIDYYLNTELQQAIDRAKEYVLSGQRNYEDFFEPTNFKGYGEEWKPIIDEIICAFDVDTLENSSETQVLERILDMYNLPVFNDEEVKDYEIMAVMTLKHIENALCFFDKEIQKEEFLEFQLDKVFSLSEWLRMREEDGIKYILNAWNSFDEFQKFKHSEELYLALQKQRNDIVLAIRSEIGRKAVNARHKKTNELKKQAITEYKAESVRYKDQNMRLSKNHFARQFALKHNLSFDTVRNNWLKGKV
ncbi:hypothetical protein Q7539_10950 [Glaesserella parasuis]|uniref:hypothetical protein n=1 Tax=Glaesserella parasuis TaxID=738 RepID=UPI00271F6AD4|nr:hypothetical protein [Glaesserella parasuis]